MTNQERKQLYIDRQAGMTWAELSDKYGVCVQSVKDAYKAKLNEYRKKGLHGHSKR